MKRLLLIALTALPAFAAAAQVPAPEDDATFQAGLKAYHAQDFATALDRFSAACDTGQPLGCFNLAIMADQGQGQPPSPAAARAYFNQACEMKVPQGCHSAAVFAEKGLGGASDFAEARKLYEAACQSGWSKACFNRALMAAGGRGGPADLAEARSYHATACEGGLGNGCNNLGLAQYAGIGGEKDIPAAFLSFGKACNDVADSCRMAGNMAYLGEGTTVDQTQARAFYLKGCDLRDPVSCHNAGWVMDEGLGGAKDLPTARLLHSCLQS